MLFLLLTSTIASAPPSGLVVGPCTYYLFRPSVTVEAPREPATVRIFFPKPHAEPRQQLMRLFDYPADAETDFQFDKGRQNEFIVLAAEVAPDRPLTLHYSAIVGLSGLEWSEDPAATTDSRELPRAEVQRLRPYLTPTEHTGRGTARFKAVAMPAVAGEANPIRRARRLYDLVLDRMRYERLEGFKGASRAWEESLGECCDYAAVFVALCRSVGIPARVVAGFHFDNDAWQMHAWAEFYVHNLGWIPCDPSFGDAPAAADLHFARLNDRYLALSRDCDLLLPGPGAKPLGVVQQYVFRYQSPERPKLSWQVSGRRFGPKPPADPTPVDAPQPFRRGGR